LIKPESVKITQNVPVSGFVKLLDPLNAEDISVSTTAGLVAFVSPSTLAIVLPFLKQKRHLLFKSQFYYVRLIKICPYVKIIAKLLIESFEYKN